MQADWVKYTLNMLGQKGSIGAFKYSTAGVHLLSAIISRSTGKSAREFANERLFKPIGMKVIPHYDMKSFGYRNGQEQVSQICEMDICYNRKIA